MIVTTDFLEHWKTRQLVELTGDESSPLALIRLWGHCQNSKRSVFPDMTPAQLASICRWNNRKPACHVALVRCGFVEKLSPKGFAAHDWDEQNAKLLANWENGKLGGRPKKEEFPNEIDQSEKPVGFVGLTQPKPIEQIEQTRLIEKREQNRTDATEPSTPSPAPHHSTTHSADGSGSLSVNGGFGSGSGSAEASQAGPLAALVQTIARKTTESIYPEGGAPSLEQVREHMNSLFRGAGDYAHEWLQRMKRQQWKDNRGNPIRDWKKLAASWASGCERRNRGVSSSQRPDRNAGTYNKAEGQYNKLVR